MGDTSTATGDNFTDTAGGVGNCQANTWPGNDLVYAVTPATTGMLTVTMNATYLSGLLHVRTACPGTASTEIACDFSGTPGNLPQAKFMVTGGTPYYVVADSYGGRAGMFTLTFMLN
jgi:hypothetical protein